MHDSKWNAENIVDFHLTNKLQKSSFNKKKTPTSGAFR